MTEGSSEPGGGEGDVGGEAASGRAGGRAAGGAAWLQSLLIASGEARLALATRGPTMGVVGGCNWIVEAAGQ